MPLSKTLLEKQLLKFFSENKKTANDSAKDLASIIFNFVKSATVTVNGNAVAPPGIPTAGTPAAQVTTAPINSTVSGVGTIQ